MANVFTYILCTCLHMWMCMCPYVWAYLVRLAVAPIGVFLNLEMTNKTHRSDVPEVQTKYNCIRRLYLWMNECAAVTIGYSSPFLNETNRTLVPIPIPIPVLVSVPCLRLIACLQAVNAEGEFIFIIHQGVANLVPCTRLYCLIGPLSSDRLGSGCSCTPHKPNCSRRHYLESS